MKVAYGLNRLMQQRGEVGMWLTEARIERGGRAGRPAAKTGGEVDVELAEESMQGVSGFLAAPFRPKAVLQRSHGD